MSISTENLIQKANQRLELMQEPEKTQIQEAIWMIENQGETRSQISDSQYQKLMQIDRQELSPGETSKIQIDVLGQELAEAGVITESDLDSNADLEDALEVVIDNLKDEKEAVKEARELLIRYFDTTQPEKSKFLTDMEQQVKWMSEEIEAEANPEPEKEFFEFPYENQFAENPVYSNLAYSEEAEFDRIRKQRELATFGNNQPVAPKTQGELIKNQILALKIEEQQLKNEALKVKIQEQKAKYAQKYVTIVDVTPSQPKFSTFKALMWFIAIVVFPPNLLIFLVFYFSKQLKWVLKIFVMFLSWIGEITIQLLLLALVGFIKILHKIFPKTRKIITLQYD
jgi:hypothetical protein